MSLDMTLPYDTTTPFLEDHLMLRPAAKYAFAYCENQPVSPRSETGIFPRNISRKNAVFRGRQIRKPPGFLYTISTSFPQVFSRLLNWYFNGGIQLTCAFLAAQYFWWNIR